MVNRAIRSQTYAIESVANVDDYDNMFYMQPDTDQDFKMGMMQQISRAMIGIVEAYNNWSVTSATYSYPRTTVGFIDGNAQAQALAENIANNLDPLDTPCCPSSRTSTIRRTSTRWRSSPSKPKCTPMPSACSRST